MTQSVRYRISAAFVAALRAQFEPAAKVKRNPREPSPAKDGSRIVLFVDGRDGLIEQPGQQPKRTFSFQVGVLNRSEGDAAEAGADADYVAAEAVLRGAYAPLAAALAAVGVQLGAMHEREITFASEDVDVGGALVLGAYDIDYRSPKPAR